MSDPSPSSPAAAMPFLEAEFDLPPAAGPVRSYIIASTPRSGSMLLCDLLLATGRMGVPAEYFKQRDMIAPMAGRLGLALPVGMGTYVRELLRRRATANGVFGAKIHIQQAWGVIAQPNFRRYLAGSRFVWLRRRDVMAQAVSMAIAMRTNLWFRPRGSADTPRPAAAAKGGPGSVDIGALFDALGMIRAENDFWQRFFQINGIRPLEVTYEDVLADPGPPVAAICRLMDVDPGPAPRLDQSRFEAQSGGDGSAWREGLVRMLRVVDERRGGDAARETR